MQTHAQDPVCRRRINRNKAHITIEYNGERYHLCCPHCQASFEREPDKYAKAQARSGSGKKGRHRH